MYKRIMIKISGEALEDKENHLPYKTSFLERIETMVQEIRDLHTDVMIVVGGGNIFRGKIANSIGVDRATGDYMGMLATIMNAMALQSFFESKGLPTRVMSALPLNACCEPYIRRKALRHLEKGRVVIFAAGVGSPYFTTDTCTALRAKEMMADCIFMGKNGVEGVYTADPKKDPKAALIDKITYHEMLTRGLQVMDNTAVGLLEDTDIQIRVFNMTDPHNAVLLLKGEKIGTLITR